MHALCIERHTCFECRYHILCVKYRHDIILGQWSINLQHTYSVVAHLQDGAIYDSADSACSNHRSIHTGIGKSLVE